MKKYILYCAQEANFQTRSMLIPYDKYLKSDLVKDFEILRKNAKPYEFIIGDKSYHIDKLLVYNININGNSDQDVNCNFHKIIDKLTQYAFGIDISNTKDEIWYSSAYINLCCGFNHIENFIELVNKKSYKGIDIDIVESFLVLEKYN